MRIRRCRALCVVVAGGILWAGLAPSTRAALPLGPPSLEERRSTSAVAPGVSWTHIARGRPSPQGAKGPWRVNVLRVSAGVRLDVRLSNGAVPGLETVRTMTREASAVAAVNGGFFGSRGLFDGDPIGVLAFDGELVSEPVGGRAALVVPRSPGARPRVARLRFAGEVRAGGKRRLLDGLNRARGLIPSCGGRGGDLPAERPGAATVCTDHSELVQLTPLFGTRTRTDRHGVEAIVRAGMVRRLREDGNSRIPADGYVLSGSGDAAEFLRREVVPGEIPTVDLTLRAGNRPLRTSSLGAIVGGGPQLVKDGQLRVGTVREGFSSAFAARNPRTLAGVTRRGKLLVVTVDGRSRRSVGVTLTEAARLMRALGARDALNLDGGGSTTMVIDGELANRPSDGRERAVSDALLVLPG